MESPKVTQLLVDELLAACTRGIRQREDLADYRPYGCRLSLVSGPTGFQLTLQFTFGGTSLVGLTKMIPSPEGFNPDLQAEQILDTLSAMAALYNQNFTEDEDDNND